MKYQAGDKLVVTESTSLPVTPFHNMVLAKGYGLVVKEVLDEFSSYTVSRRGSVFNIDAGKLESFTQLESMKDKRYKRVVETGLSYGQAMEKLLKEGKKVSRAVWDGYWVVQTIGNLNGSPSWSGQFIVACLKNGSQAIASPYQEDMFATDWMVVE